MTASARIDRIDTLECRERLGIIQNLTRLVTVLGLEGTDYTALWETLSLAGIPAANSYLNEDGFHDLQLVERNAKMIDRDKAEVTLQYENMRGEGQILASPPNDVITGEMSVSVQQIATDMDRDGNKVTVSHTYPADDKNFPNETLVLPGEMQVYVPQKVLTLQGVKPTQTPWLIANQIVGALNAGPWSLGAARTWMCMKANWKWIGYNQHTLEHFYNMTFEFQYNKLTWNPYVIFIDPKTGQQPANLVEGVGRKYIQYQEEVDFESIMGAVIQGG